SDTYWLAFKLMASLGSLGWSVPRMPHPIIADRSELCKSIPALQCMGGQPFGVTVLTRENPSNDEVGASGILVNALVSSMRGWAPGVFSSAHSSVPPQTIRILVGPKP